MESYPSEDSYYGERVFDFVITSKGFDVARFNADYHGGNPASCDCHPQSFVKITEPWP